MEGAAAVVELARASDLSIYVQSADAQEVAAMREAYREECGDAPPPDAVRDIIGLSLADAVRRITPSLAAGSAERVIANYRRHYAAQRGAATLFPGVCDTLAGLRREGYLLAVATGKVERPCRGPNDDHRWVESQCEAYFVNGFVVPFHG